MILPDTGDYLPCHEPVKDNSLLKEPGVGSEPSSSKIKQHALQQNATLPSCTQES
jgi:hypothetical protein